MIEKTYLTGPIPTEFENLAALGTYLATSTRVPSNMNSQS